MAWKKAGWVALATSFICGAAQADSGEDFYRTKPNMRMIVSSTPGGGYDMMARLAARYFSKYLPGEPAIVVQNMPGGGGITATNYLYNVAPKDGTTLGHIDRGMATTALLYGANTQAQFKAVELNWLGSISREVGVGLVSKGSPARSLDDMRKREIVVGTNGPETDSAMYARLSNQLLGTKFKIVFGYPGQTEYYLALTRREVDGIFMTGWSGPNRLAAMKDIESGALDFFVQMASTRHPDAPNTPTMRELVTDEKDLQVVDILLSRLDLGRPFVAPPGTPPERVALLRKAFDLSAADPEMRADSEKIGIRVDAISGVQAQATIAKLYKTPEDVRARMQSVVQIGK
ncbi:MAG: efflux transporter protein [Hyphomicrobiales bacterium]|jgi:tripartite-type tricarboxylate transporter receptor subunit TctC|nr:efflux transporter protein [Hyphomicrobiales bacterium]